MKSIGRLSVRPSHRETTFLTQFCMPPRCSLSKNGFSLSRHLPSLLETAWRAEGKKEREDAVERAQKEDAIQGEGEKWWVGKRSTTVWLGWTTWSESYERDHYRYHDLGHSHIKAGSAKDAPCAYSIDMHVYNKVFYQRRAAATFG